VKARRAETDRHTGARVEGELIAGYRSVAGQCVVEEVCGPAPGERLAGTLVELSRNSEQLLGAVDAEISPLGKVVTHQPVGVLVAASLPRRVGIAEEHLGTGQ
jgi:hypothetical protein